MPSAAFLKAAAAANRQPVILLAIESVDAIKRQTTTQADWAGTTRTAVNYLSEPGKLFLATDGPEAYSGTYPGAVQDSSVISPVATLVSYQWSIGAEHYILLDGVETPSVTTGSTATGITLNVRCRNFYAVDEVTTVLGDPEVEIYGRLNGGAWQLLATRILPRSGNMQYTYPLVGDWAGSHLDMPVTVSDLDRGQWEVKIKLIALHNFLVEGFAPDNAKIGIVSFADTHDTHYVGQGTVITPALDLGVTPSIPSRFEVDDTIPTGTTAAYLAWGSDDSSTWSALGSVVDGAELAPYRYYYFRADLTSTGIATPYLDELRLIGGDSQFLYFSTHKDEPIQGAKPYIAPSGISALSSKIDLTQQATIGELSVKLLWRPAVGDMIATGFLKNKFITAKLGFLGLSEPDYEPYFTGTWYDYQSDQEKGIINVKTRNILKRFTKKIPDAGYFVDANGQTYDPARVYNLSGNIMTVMLDIVDLLGVPDRQLNRTSFTAIGSGSRSGADWQVTRDLTEPKDALDMLQELAISAGVFFFEAPDGRLTARLYDDFAAADPIATLDAMICRFKPVDGGQKDLYTRQAIYYDLIAGKDGGSTTDYAKCHLYVNDLAEIDWQENATKEWQDKWGLSVVAVQLLALRWDSWFANPRQSVTVEDVPPRYDFIEPGHVVAVDNLQLPCPIEDWNGFTSGTRFLVMGKSHSDPTAGNLTLSFDLMQIGEVNFVTDPDFPTYSPQAFWPAVQNLDLSERLILRTTGALDNVLRISYDDPADFHFGGAEIWVQADGGAWDFKSSVPFNAPQIRRTYDLPVRIGHLYTVCVRTRNAAGFLQSLAASPTASRTVLGVNDVPEQEVVTVTPGTPSSPGVTVPGVQIPSDDPEYTLPAVSGLQLFGPDPHADEFIGQTAVFEWRCFTLAGNQIAVGVAASVAYGLRDYEVRILNTDGTFRRVEHTLLERYSYTYEHNYDDGVGSAVREFAIEVYARDNSNRISALPARMIVTNPAPPAISLTLNGEFKGFSVNITPSSLPDVAGYSIHASQFNGFTPADDTCINRGPETFFRMAAPTGGTWYIRAAAYDTFGEDSLNYSPQYAVTIDASQVLPDDLYTSLRVDFVILDSIFNFGDNGVSPTTGTETTLFWTAGHIIRGATTFALAAGNLTSAANRWVIATLASGSATLSLADYSAGIPALAANQVIIAYTSASANSAGNYLCYVRQANSMQVEGASIRDLTALHAVINDITADQALLGTLYANLISVLDLVVGGNVTMGPDATIAWSKVEGHPNATYIDADGFYTGALTAEQVNAVDIDAGSVTAGTFTGLAFRTADDTSTEQIKIDASTNRQYFTGLNRVTGGTKTLLSSVGSSTAGAQNPQRAIFFAGDDSTGVSYSIGGATVDTATASDLIGFYGVSTLGYGIMGSSVSSTGVAGFSQHNGLYGYGWNYGAVLETKGGVSPGTAPLRLIPAAASTAPTHGADIGALWVTSTGVLYINTSGSTTWTKVGAQ